MIKILAIKYVLDTLDAAINASALGTMLCDVSANDILEVAKWCMMRDRETSNYVRFPKLMKVVMPYRPDACVIAHQVFFLRAASMPTMRSTFEWIIKHDRFDHATELVTRLRAAYERQQLSRLFFLDAIHLVQAHHAIDPLVQLPVLPLDAEGHLTLHHLRDRICSTTIKNAPKSTSPYKCELMCDNEVDPLSMQAVDDIHPHLLFEVDGYLFNIIAFADYIHMTLDMVLDSAPPCADGTLPKHPFTNDHIKYATICACKRQIYDLWQHHMLDNNNNNTMRKKK